MMMFAEEIASTPAMQGVFSPHATVQAMLDVEAALAKAGASIGLLPFESARAIAGLCGSQMIDLPKLAASSRHAGTIIIPLVQWLKEAAPEHAKFVHIAGTSQDIIDTGLVLQLRAGILRLQADLGIIANAAANLAHTYAAAKMVGRTLLQGALPATFGLKAASWLVAVTDSRRAIAHAARDALRLQCGGAAGTLDVPGEQAPAFLRAFGAALSLPVPVLPWHTSRAPLARLAAAIAGAAGVAGKIGTDIAHLMQPEIGEVAEPAAPGRGGSSAMAHKRNPTLSIAARAAAIRMPGYVATLLAAQDQEHERAAGAWQAEAATWPALMLCASGGIAAMAEALAGLEVFVPRMANNLSLLPDAQSSPAIPGMIADALADHHAFESDAA
jgi:3-carboxy-cis,cis-muconate cycloisomerase